MESSPRIVFWTTGGIATGFGHVRRCLSLAEAVRGAGTTTVFVLDADEPVVTYVKQHGFEVMVSSQSPPLRALHDCGASAVVVDSYTVTTADLRRLQSEFMVAAIDDLSDRELPVDIVINSSPAKSKADYRALPSTRFLLGPAYALLRPEFAFDLPPERVKETVERVFVSVGGSDPHRLTPGLVQALVTALPDVHMDVIAGPLFDTSFENEIRAITHAATCHRDPHSMRDLMLSADIAVCGGGQTTFELAATGTPSIAISTAANQHVNLSAFQKLGTLEWAGDAASPGIAGCVASAVKALQGDATRRRQISERGRALVDGRGGARAARSLVETFNAANQNL